MGVWGGSPDETVEGLGEGEVDASQLAGEDTLVLWLDGDGIGVVFVGLDAAAEVYVGAVAGSGRDFVDQGKGCSVVGAEQQ